jgi:hypothetical protein
MLSTDSVSVDRMGTTIAMDHGYVDYKGFQIDIFGTPGQERFDPIIELLVEDTHAIIVAFDLSRMKETVERTKKIMKKCGVFKIPSVIAANKQDLNPSVTIDELQAMLEFNGVIIFTTATDNKGREELLDSLLEVIFNSRLNNARQN